MIHLFHLEKAILIVEEDGWTVEDQVEDQIPEGDKGHEVVELVGPVHCDAQHKRQEVHLEQNLKNYHHHSLQNLHRAIPNQAVQAHFWPFLTHFVAKSTKKQMDLI